MENLSEVKKLHNQIQNNIFQILVDYNLLCHISSAFPSRVPFYYFSEDYKFLVSEIPLEVNSFINSVNRLLETGYLSIISDSSDKNIYFVKTEEFDLLTNSDEKEYFNIINETQISNLQRKDRRFQLLG